MNCLVHNIDIGCLIDNDEKLKKNRNNDDDGDDDYPIPPSILFSFLLSPILSFYLFTYLYLFLVIYLLIYLFIFIFEQFVNGTKEGFSSTGFGMGVVGGFRFEFGGIFCLVENPRT